MDVLIFAMLGLVSGTATSWILQPVPFGTFSVWPGLLFGIAITLFSVWRKKARGWLKPITFVILSIVSYYIAFQVADGSSIFLDSYAPWLWYFLGGFAGALILSLSYSWPLRRLSWKQIIMLALLGGILGAVGYLVSFAFCANCYTTDMSGGGTGFNWLYIIWQTGMALMFAFA